MISGLERIAVIHRGSIFGTWLATLTLSTSLFAQAPAGLPPSAPLQGAPARGDIDLVERLMAARRDYQGTLEQLRAYYARIGDVERARGVEEELRQYHRINKPAYVL